MTVSSPVSDVVRSVVSSVTGDAEVVATLFSHDIRSEADSTTISGVNALRVRIDSGSWQTLAAASLTISQTADGELTVAGFSGSETTIEFTYEDPASEWYSTASSIDAIYAQKLSDSGPALSGLPGIPINPTVNPVVAS